MNADLLVGAVSWGVIFLFFVWAVFRSEGREEFVSLSLMGGFSVHIGSALVWALIFPAQTQNWGIKELQFCAIVGMLLAFLVLAIAIGWMVLREWREWKEG